MKVRALLQRKTTTQFCANQAKSHGRLYNKRQLEFVICLSHGEPSGAALHQHAFGNSLLKHRDLALIVGGAAAGAAGGADYG